MKRLTFLNELELSVKNRGSNFVSTVSTELCSERLFLAIIKMNSSVSLSDLPTEALEAELSDLKARQKLVENELKLRRKKNADIVADCGLTLQEIRRFSRHLLLPEFGVSGQARISKTRRGVLVVGAGGLGCPALQFLASSGVGRIGIVDHDTGKHVSFTPLVPGLLIKHLVRSGIDH